MFLLCDQDPPDRPATGYLNAFFANVISGWTVQADQSNGTNNSDLQVSKINGTAFTMSHKMGLVRLNLISKSPYNVKYYLSTDNNYKFYTTTTTTVYSSTSFTALPSNISTLYPAIANSTYYAIVEANSATTSQNFTFTSSNTLVSTADGTNDWTYTASLKSGEYAAYTASFNVTYLASSQYTLQLGDVFYSDGSVSRPGSSNLMSGKTPIGVVVFIPSNNTEKEWTEPSHNGGHALVMALTNSVSGKVLYDNTVSNGYPQYSGKYKTPYSSSGSAYDDWKNDKSGYTNTHTYLSTTGSPAGYYALHHSPAGPTSSSGWFLPTVGQWIYVLAPRANLNPTSIVVSGTSNDTSDKARTALNGYLSASGASYTTLVQDFHWTNTNWIYTNGEIGIWNLNFYATTGGFRFNGESNKADGDHLGYVRPFLAF